MQAVGAAWLMTSLSSSTLQIALIQTASALPFFLLSLPAGSIGDIVDRRRLILGPEIWMIDLQSLTGPLKNRYSVSPWRLPASVTSFMPERRNGNRPEPLKAVRLRPIPSH